MKPCIKSVWRGVLRTCSRMTISGMQMRNFAYVHVQTCVWGALLTASKMSIALGAGGIRTSGNEHGGLPMQSLHVWSQTCAFSDVPIPCDKCNRHFRSRKQKHFKHNSSVCERKRCFTSTFVMIMLQHVRWPFNSLHEGFMYKRSPNSKTLRLRRF